MKHTFALFAFALFNLISCSSDEKPIDILLNAPKGALLINTQIGSDNFIINDPESSFSVEVRAHDQRKGKFFDFVRVYISFESNTSDGINSLREIVLEDIPRSEFYLGEFGRPRITLEYSFQQVLDAFSIDVSQVVAGDQFFIRPDMHLKDGRIIGFENRSPSIIADFCEDSPFYYQVNVVNPINEQLFTGTYSYEVISSTNLEDFTDSGITTISSGEFTNQRRSDFLDFTIAGDFILPDIYQEKGGSCSFGQEIVFWGPQGSSFGELDLSDDTVFFADIVLGYDGWVGGDLSAEPILARYRFSKQ